MQKNKKKSKSRLWTVLAVLNVAGIAFPLSYYFQADGGAQVLAAVILVCAGFFLLILDGITVLLANSNVNEL